MKAVRKNIKQALQTVTTKNAPRVYDSLQTKVGYKNIEDMVLNMMIDNNMTASATIPHIEEMI